MIHRPKAFLPAELERVNDALSPELVAWAAASPLVGTDGAFQPVRSHATLFAFDRAQLASIRLRDFRRAARRSGTVSGPLPELAGLSTREVGGRAAGQMAVAKTVVAWYGLEAVDFSRLAGDPEAVVGSMLTEGLEAAVCTAPMRLGITTYTPQDVYHETIPEAAAAVGVHGSDALEPYVDFPAYPAILDLAA